MKFASTLALLASAGLSSANLGGVLICQGPDATENCVYNVYQMNTCYNLTEPYFQNASTFAPDGEAFVCNPRVTRCGDICTSPTGCTFGDVSFDYVNKFNLSAINWTHLISSFDCHLNRTDV